MFLTKFSNLSFAKLAVSVTSLCVSLFCEIPAAIFVIKETEDVSIPRYPAKTAS